MLLSIIKDQFDTPSNYNVTCCPRTRQSRTICLYFKHLSDKIEPYIESTHAYANPFLSDVTLTLYNPTWPASQHL